MQLESGFVATARVDIEKPRVARRTEIVNSQTAGLGADVRSCFAHCRSDGFFLAFAGVKANDCIQLHARPYIVSSTLTGASDRSCQQQTGKLGNLQWQLSLSGGPGQRPAA